PGALAHGAVLLTDQLEEGRAPPPPGTLVGAGPPPGSPGIEVVHALPAVLLAEDAALGQAAAVERRQAAAARPLALVVRVTEEVVVPVRLAGALGRVRPVLVHRAEPPDVELGDVVRRLALHQPLGQDVADRPAGSEAGVRQAGRDPEARNAGDRPEQRATVRGDPLGAVGEVHQLRLGQDGHAPDRTLHDL